jgi:hypothetical protein
MEHFVPLKKTNPSLRAVCRLAFFGLALSVQCSSAFAADADPTPPQATSSQGSYDTIHSIQISKAQTSKKHRIKLYSDARQQVLFFSANGQEGKVYQLYLFDMDGRLVSQTRIRSRETTVLSNISEGNFLFEVFTDDERIENGQLTVR